jgi:hypothetical protein
MHRPGSFVVFAPLAAALVLGVSARADAQESPQYAPLPAQPPPTVVVQQPQYAQPQYAPPPGPPPVYQTGPVYAQPGYPPPQMYAPPPGMSPQYGVQNGPRVIRNWDESQPLPPGYHVESRVRVGLIVGGAVTFGTMYLLTALVAGLVDDGGGSAGACYVPGIGPFIQMGQADTATDGFLLALDGIVQLGGIAMLVAGIAAPKTELVRNDIGGVHFNVAPIIAKDHTGMGLVGTF